MFRKAKSLVGLDIGSSAVKAVELKTLLLIGVLAKFTGRPLLLAGMAQAFDGKTGDKFFDEKMACDPVARVPMPHPAAAGK